MRRCSTITITPFLGRALSIGGADWEYLRSVASQLCYLGFEPVEGGRLLFNGVRLVGKGHNSVVVMCVSPYGNGPYSCKIRRRDAQRGDLLAEAYALMLANSVGVGPRLVSFTRDVVVYRYVDGVPLGEWYRSERRLETLCDLLLQGYKLDGVGLLHRELTRPWRHVLVDRSGTPYIIDFETVSRGTRGTNVARLAAAICGLMGCDPRVLSGPVRRYSRDRTLDALAEVARAIGLECRFSP